MTTDGGRGQLGGVGGGCGWSGRQRKGYTQNRGDCPDRGGRRGGAGCWLGGFSFRGKGVGGCGGGGLGGSVEGGGREAGLPSGESERGPWTSDKTAVGKVRGFVVPPDTIDHDINNH